MKVRNGLFAFIGAISLCAPFAARAVCLTPDGEAMAGRPSVAQEYKNSDYVVKGFVESAKVIPDPEDPQGFLGAEYKIHVSDIYKGAPLRKITLYTGNDSGRFFMEVPGLYVLFLHKREGNRNYVVDNCGNSKELTGDDDKTVKILEILKPLKNAK